MAGFIQPIAALGLPLPKAAAAGTLLIQSMSLLDDKRDDLEKYEFMMGVPRGRLAVALDLLTDALVLVGQHGVYCQSTRQPNKPAIDLQIVLEALNSSKELISSVMEELKKSSV